MPNTLYNSERAKEINIKELIGITLNNVLVSSYLILF